MRSFSSRFGLRQIVRAATVGIALVISGCATLQVRDSFTLAELEVAEIAGMPEIRYWADSTSSALDHAVRARLAQTSARGSTVHSGPPTILALSGGADDGAFGAGLLNGWSARGNRPEFTLVTGVSTGAMIAPLAFLGPSHDDALRHAYTEISAANVYQSRGAAGLFGSDALASSVPLHNLVASFADEALLAAVAAEHRKGRRLLVATTNLDMQRPVMWDLGAIAASDRPNSLTLFRNIIVASASVPGLFPPVLIESEANGKIIKEMHVDGGVTMNVFALPRDLALGGRVRGRGRMYVIYNGRVDPDFSVVQIGTLPIAKRSVSTLLKSHGKSALRDTYEFARRNGIAFNLASVGADFTTTSPNLFDKAYMNALYEYGYARGQAGYSWRNQPH